MLKQSILCLLASSLLASDRSTYVEHKTVHALVGTGVYLAFREKGHEKTGLAVVLGLGIAKELYDRKHGGSFRMGDVAWTAGPSFVVSYSLKF